MASEEKSAASEGVPEGVAPETAETETAEKTETAPASEDSGTTAGETPQPSSPVSEEDASAGPDWKDLYARLRADFDNFKKRTARDREDTYRFAEADILKDILPTVDNLALALANAKNPEDDFVKGVQLVYDTLLKALGDHGAKPFDSVGNALDTERMEAIATFPSDTVAEGKVTDEIKRGWTLKDKVLRVAQVVVSSGKPNG